MSQMLMLIVGLAILLVIYVVYSRPSLVLQSGGGQDQHFKIVLISIVDNDVRIEARLYDENNKLLQQQMLATGDDIKEYISTLKATGKKVYIASLISDRDTDNLKVWLRNNNNNADAIERYKSIVTTIMSFNDIMCGDYTQSKTDLNPHVPECMTFPKSYDEVLDISGMATATDLKSVLKDLKSMASSGDGSKETLDKAVVRMEQVKDIDNDAAKSVSIVQDKKRDIEEKINSHPDEATRSVLIDHHKKLDGVEKGLYEVGKDVKKAHALLTTIKDNVKPTTPEARHKVEQLNFELEKIPKCPVCPLFADSHPVSIWEVDHQGIGSIVKNK